MTLHELLGRPVLFLRWSFLRVLIGMKHMLTEWQVGDGREEAVARFVVSNAPKGDINAVIAAIDEYAYRHKFLMNVGDKKGALLDGVIERVKPKRVLELGAYVGYSALRIARKLPAGGHLYSVEFNAANAAVARRIIEHAGATDRVTFVHGFLGDGGKTFAHLANDLGFVAGSLDAAFIDHAKEAYLPDLMSILQNGWLRPGAVVVADNIGFPGAPGYREYMDAEEGKRWRTTAHQAHLEYQSLVPDVVLESTLIG
ncbi:MAG: O-methyltransferase [Myxococcota bacterium]|nr:class I SAM-dependent methyltransferase [Myxococcota bacterium]